MPGDSHLLHLTANRGDELAAPDEAEVAVAEGGQRVAVSFPRAMVGFGVLLQVGSVPPSTAPSVRLCPHIDKACRPTLPWDATHGRALVAGTIPA
ncbi:MAG TPA: hypothetical protein VJB57_02375 [Dehalococcoidia bacterium]|nr:hypothetical protein [Dehalococcoidia bacterium]